MKTVSLKIDDVIFGETEEILARMKMPWNRYINEAIAFYNKLKRGQMLEQKLRVESGMVKSESMKVLNEFDDAD